MGYRLGVDLGTTFTAAAVDDGSGPTMVGLGNRALTVPSTVFLADDGTLLLGEAAERRASKEPSRAAREFKRRIGDSVPILLGGQPFSPQALSARLLAWVVATASERQGAPPEEVVVTYPANWGGYKRELLAQVVTLSDLPGAVTCTEPEAAAVQYATHAALAPGDTVVVYDLGGGTFDACVLERRDAGFAIIGSPDGVEHLGGIDFDEAVYQHVLGMLGDDLADVDPDDPRVVDALVRLKRECVAAKESLSGDVEATIDVELPGVSRSLRLTRPEFESLVASPLRDTLDATRRALRSAGLEAADVSAAVLVGGSSRIPMVSHLLQSELAVRTAMDTHPKHDVALGAARYRAPSSGASAPAAAPTVIEWPTRAGPQAEPPVAAAGSPTVPQGPPPAPPAPIVTTPPVTAPPEAGPDRGSGPWVLYVVLAAALALLAVAVTVLAMQPPQDTSLTWSASSRSGQTGEISRRTTLDASVLGIPLPGEVSVKRSGSFTVTQNLALFAAGPVDVSGAVSGPSTLVRDEDDAWWRPVATVPGGFMVLAFLFAVAYAESHLRSIRRGRGALRLGELIGLLGVGMTLGLCLVMLSWALGDHLEWSPVLAVIVCSGAALGMLAFAVSSRRRAGGPST